MSEPIFRCLLCCRDTKTKSCERCQTEDFVTDRTKPHTPHWSRKTINKIECKICDREAGYEQQLVADDMCNPTPSTV